MLVKELAARTGIKKATLDSYLRNSGYLPSVDTAVKIAQALGVTVEYLVTGEENSSETRLMELDLRILVQNFKVLGENDRKMVLGIVQLIKNQRKAG